MHLAHPLLLVCIVFLLMLSFSLYLFSRRNRRTGVSVGQAIMPKAGSRQRDTPIEAFARRLQPYGITVRRGPAPAAACGVGSVLLDGRGDCNRCNRKEKYFIAEIVPAELPSLVEEKQRGKVCLACGSWLWSGPMVHDAGFFGAFPRNEYANMFDTLDLLEAGACGRNEGQMQLLRRIEGRLERHLAYVRMALAWSDRVAISRPSSPVLHAEPRLHIGGMS